MRENAFKWRKRECSCTKITEKKTDKSERKRTVESDEYIRCSPTFDTEKNPEYVDLHQHLLP